MKKSEILEKSRDEKSDERKESIDNKAFLFGAIPMVLISFILIAWKEFHNQSYWDIASIICSGLTVGALIKYKINKNILYLVIGIVAGITTISCLIIYLIYGDYT